MFEYGDGFIEHRPMPGRPAFFVLPVPALFFCCDQRLLTLRRLCLDFPCIAFATSPRINELDLAKDLKS
jgi:hypothetical protein